MITIAIGAKSVDVRAIKETKDGEAFRWLARLENPANLNERTYYEITMEEYEFLMRIHRCADAFPSIALNIEKPHRALAQ